LSQIDGCWAKCNPQILMQLGKLWFAGDDISRKHFIYLLSPPLLLELEIVRCSTLNDDVLQKVAGIRNFCNLKMLNLRRCHGVTKKGIDVLMNAQNSLKEITFCFCNNISESDIENWEKQAKDNNWELSIYFREVVCIYL
jgi:hypothetical protein